jgi:hypothetical protein
MSPSVTDSSDIGWEEVTEAALTHLLRTALAKSSKEAAAAVAPLATAPDTQRLRKHTTGTGAGVGAAAAAGVSIGRLARHQLAVL